LSFLVFLVVEVEVEKVLSGDDVAIDLAIVRRIKKPESRRREEICGRCSSTQGIATSFSISKERVSRR